MTRRSSGCNRTVQAASRRASLKRFKDGWMKEHAALPSADMCLGFATGFNIGWKSRRSESDE